MVNTYSKVEGKTYTELKNELIAVFKKYSEYRDFYKMVSEFAEDPFFNLHFVAKEFLKVSFEDFEDISDIRKLEKERKAQW